MTLTRRNLWCYALGTVGRDMAAAGLFMGHLLNYVLYTRTLTAEQFGAISVIMIVARLFDALNDPIMGNILDATHTRWGRFKPWMAVGALGTVAVILISFTNTAQGWGYVALFGVLYFAFSITFTMNDIAYWGMLPSLAEGAADRDRLTSLASLMGGVGAFLCGLIVPTFTAGAHVIGGNAPTAYAVIAVLFGLCMLATQAVTLAGVRERPLRRDAQAEARRTRVSPRGIVQTIRQNDQALYAALILLVYFITITINGTVSATYLYFTFGYNGLLITLFVVLGQVASAAIYLCYPAISRRVPRRRMVGIATALGLGGYGAMFLVGLLAPGAGMVKFGAMALANLFANAAGNVYYLVMLITIANAVEYNEWKFHRRSDGIIFSVRPFVTKLGAAIAQFLSMLAYLAIGVLGVTNQISDIENEAARGLMTMAEKTGRIEAVIASVVGEQRVALLLCVTLVPALGLWAMWTIYRRRITLDEATYARILTMLAGREERSSTNV